MSANAKRKDGRPFCMATIGSGKHADRLCPAAARFRIFTDAGEPTTQVVCGKHTNFGPGYNAQPLSPGAPGGES